MISILEYLDNDVKELLGIYVMENEYLKIFFISMLPITELRLTIPIGLLEYNLNWFYVFAISVLGNFIVCIPLVYLLRFIETIF